MILDRYIAKQLKNPSGIGGWLSSFIMNRQNLPLYDETLKQLAVSDFDSILDIGCGNGYMLSILAKEYDCKLTGIDTSSSILKAAARCNRSFISTGRMELKCQNISNMSFPDNSFSKVYTINTIYFWDNLTETMKEINRILKPEGLFINTLFSNETLSKLSHTRFGYKRYSVNQITSIGVDTGFSTNVVPILNGLAYCIVYEKS